MDSLDRRVPLGFIDHLNPPQFGIQPPPSPKASRQVPVVAVVPVVGVVPLPNLNAKLPLRAAASGVKRDYRAVPLSPDSAQAAKQPAKEKVKNLVVAVLRCDPPAPQQGESYSWDSVEQCWRVESIGPGARPGINVGDKICGLINGQRVFFNQNRPPRALVAYPRA